MHNAEEVRRKAEVAPRDGTSAMLLAYADLLEAIEEMDKNGSEIAMSVLRALRWRAAEKQKARKV